MSSRQRGAAWFVALLLAGRVLDVFDLPWEASSPEAPYPRSSPGGQISKARDERPAADTTALARRTETSGRSTKSALVPINRASLQELQGLPRIGPVIAARIVAHREIHGPFRSSADLQRVRGIGPRTAGQLAPLLCFD